MQDKDQPAFPATSWTKDGDFLGENQGMSLRDYFAAKVMQGCLAYSHVSPQWGNYHENSSVDGVAEMAYRYADAMLRVRQE